MSLLRRVILIMTLAAACCWAAELATPKGLSIQDGVMLREGKPWRGIGVNYFDAFTRTLADPNNTTSLAGLRELSQQYQIPFIRFRLAGFWPKDWKDLYLADKARYFARLDAFVQQAQQCNIGLIPSFFWYDGAVPDIVGESMDQYADPNSKTTQFIRDFTAEVITRYRDCPAIWGWEFGNEYLLRADLPDDKHAIPGIHLDMGTATRRTLRDRFKRSMVYPAYGVFARTVRQFDPHRIILTGDTAPRASAWHLSRQQGWARDTRRQFEQMLLSDTPDGFSMVSIHLYPEHDNSYFEQQVSMEDFLAVCAQTASSAGTPLYVGEFGAPATLGPEGEKAYFRRCLDAILKTDIPLAAVWIYDYLPQDKDWNITSKNSRSYMLDEIRRANQRLWQQKP